MFKNNLKSFTVKNNMSSSQRINYKAKVLQNEQDSIVCELSRQKENEEPSVTRVRFFSLSNLIEKNNKRIANLRNESAQNTTYLVNN
jgi:hypothetical protein